MVTKLVILIIVLGVIAFWRLMGVYQLSQKLKGENDEIATEDDNRKMAMGFMLFFIGYFVFVAWQMYTWGGRMLNTPASIHGEKTDWLLNVNFVLIFIPFIITHIFLAWFAFKYYGRKNTKATFYAHNNKLEMIWTIIPAIVLTFVIGYGLKTWNEITSPATADAIKIELYAQQFSWTARYAGDDNKLGDSDYKLIEGANELGIDMKDKASSDDKIVKGEFHIPVGKEIDFKFRSRDVIHSAYFPHFRTQMNAVPGMTTTFHFVPTITTKEMKKKMNNEKFEYVLLCAKICGASHWNMQMNVVVDSPEDYAKWLKEQKTLGETLMPTASAEAAPAEAPVKEEADSSKKTAMLIK